MKASPLPESMNAWVFDRFGEPEDVLGLVRQPIPGADAGSQVLVRVRAAAVNFSDALLVRGRYQLQPSLPSGAGMEISGRVVGAIPGESGLLVGQRVAGLVSALAGGFAEYAVMNVADAQSIPLGLDDIEAAAFTVAYQTAWFALHERARVQPGETVLVCAASGGVGSATVQLAKAHGARVIGVVGSEAKAGVARALGCDEVFLRSDPLIVEKIKAFGGGVDVVIDPVGGDLHRVSARVIAFEGRIVLVGFASGQPSQLSAENALVKNYTILGLHWGLYRQKRPDLVAKAYLSLCETVTAHGIRPLVSEVCEFQELPAALGRVSAGTTTGRVVLSVS